MRHGVGLVVVVGLLSACGSFASTTEADGTRPVCGPSFARTLAGDGTARVYVSGGNAYGCSVGGAGSYLLGNASYCSIESVRVAGRLAAYGRPDCGYDVVSTTVVVLRLSDDKYLMTRPATTKVGVEGDQSVGSLVLRPDGAVAWVGTARAIFSPRFVRQLARLDQRGFKVLDSGRAVAVRSLKLRGSEISWRHGNAIRKAKLL